jgi:hypothetical protein
VRVSPCRAADRQVRWSASIRLDRHQTRRAHVPPPNEALVDQFAGMRRAGEAIMLHKRQSTADDNWLAVSVPSVFDTDGTLKPRHLGTRDGLEAA